LFAIIIMESGAVLGKVHGLMAFVISSLIASYRSRDAGVHSKGEQTFAVALACLDFAI